MKNMLLTAAAAMALSVPALPAFAFELPAGCVREVQSPINNGIAAVYVGDTCPWAAGSPLRTVPAAMTGSQPGWQPEPKEPCEPKEYTAG